MTDFIPPFDGQDDGEPFTDVAVQAEAPDYNNSYRYRKRLKATRKFREAAKNLRPLITVSGYNRVINRALAHVVVNLTKQAKQMPDKYIAYSRNPGKWKTTGRKENPWSIGPKIIEIIDALEAAGYLEHKKGFYDGTTGIGRESRMRCTHKFVHEVLIPNGLMEEPTEEETDDFWAVRVRLNRGDRAFKAANTAKSCEMSRMLQAYNNLIQKTDIRIPGASEYGTDICGPALTFRSFNDRELTKGGRFYGPWWTWTHNHLRPHILINGKKTIELDYKAQHFYFMYGVYGGCHYSEIHDDEDPYYVAEGNVLYPRTMVKKFALVSINTTSRNEAWRAMVDGLKEDIQASKDADELVHLNHCLDTIRSYEAFNQFYACFLQKHEHIEGFICIDLGTSLQNFDSQVASYVLEHMTALNIPTLCIHDSFIVSEEYKETLKTKMIEAYTELGLTKALPIIK